MNLYNNAYIILQTVWTQISLMSSLISVHNFCLHDEINLKKIWCNFVIIIANSMDSERSGSAVECLTRDRGAAGLSFTGITAL